MIKQFNFYDIYGYLLPGMLLLGIFWLPIGVLTKSWPEQDLSKAVFLAALAYILGHLVRSVSSRVVPSTVQHVQDGAKQQRFPSDLFLDASTHFFSSDFKKKLAQQVGKLFGLSIDVTNNGNGKNPISSNRQTAFFQARSYLIAKKAANYVEQFEGLYAMMRGLGCTLCVGAAYLAGWGLSFHRGHCYVCILMAVLSVVALFGTLFLAWRGVIKDNYKAPGWVPWFWLGLFFGSGFWLGNSQRSEFWKTTPPQSELILWVGVFMALIAAAKCFESYRYFAGEFAKTVWRDFSACLSYSEASTASSEAVSASEDASDES